MPVSTICPIAVFTVLNWGKQKDIREVKQRVGDRMCSWQRQPAGNRRSRHPRGSPRSHASDVLEGGNGEA